MEDSAIGPGTVVNSSQVFKASLGCDCHVGPYAYVRAGTQTGDNAKIGDFVEIRNAKLGDGAKIAHLSYVADSEVGRNVQFGCGAVTANYDRAKKYRTTIGDDAFVGANVNLVAPVSVGKGAYLAAGSTITEDVPPQALAIARARQRSQKDWTVRLKPKKAVILGALPL